METVIYEQQGGVARIYLNRPDSLNALNGLLMQSLKAALLKARNDDAVKVVIVSGKGKAFSAGVDLKTTKPEDFQANGEMMLLGEEVEQIIVNFPKVTIAQVHGYCFTGALELMLFFDMAFCSDATQFGDTHAKFAIMPRWGMTQRLARRVGLNKAKELTFRALRVKGPEAERIGMVNRSFPDDTLKEEVDKIAAEIQQNSHAAIIRIKELYDQGYHTTLEKGLALEKAADTYLPDTGENLKGFKGNQ